MSSNNRRRVYGGLKTPKSATISASYSNVSARVLDSDGSVIASNITTSSKTVSGSNYMFSYYGSAYRSGTSYYLTMTVSGDFENWYGSDMFTYDLWFNQCDVTVNYTDGSSDTGTASAVALKVKAATGLDFSIGYQSSSESTDYSYVDTSGTNVGLRCWLCQAQQSNEYIRFYPTIKIGGVQYGKSSTIFSLDVDWSFSG